jgi:hypothetical protein
MLNLIHQPITTNSVIKYFIALYGSALRMSSGARGMITTIKLTKHTSKIILLRFYGVTIDRT